MFTRVYLYPFYTPVSVIKPVSELCPLLHRPPFWHQAVPHRRSVLPHVFELERFTLLVWIENVWPLSLRSLGLTPIQRPEMYIIGAQPLCSQLSGLSQVSYHMWETWADSFLMHKHTGNHSHKLDLCSFNLLKFWNRSKCSCGSKATVQLKREAPLSNMISVHWLQENLRK